MTSDFPFQFPPCYNHGRHCRLSDCHPEEAYFPSLTSDEKTEEPPGGKQKMLLRFQFKKSSPDDAGALVHGEVANRKVASLEVVEVQATRQQNPPESTQLGFVPEIRKVTAKANKNQKKRRFSFALSQDEIEADILAVSGIKPKRRPKKRSKNVKRELDHLFPGFGMNLR
ncbi:hypothetical protein SLE2022_025730 [Rubroshorea leprosula]